MATTMQQVLDRARRPLNDASKTRWPDLVLFEYAIDCLRRLLLKRPDLFVGMFSALPDFGALATGSSFPIDETYVEPTCDYIRARAQSHDTEDSEETKINLFASLFSDAVG